MGDHARRNKIDAAHLVVPGTSSNKDARPQRRGVPRSNFIDELVKAREAEHRSVRNLADMSGVTPATIRKLETGKGPVTTLLAVMRALPFQVTVLAPASSFAEQLRKRREKIGMSLDIVAGRAALPVKKIVELEAGGGTVENLLRLLSVIAPTVKRRAPERVYWSGERKAERDSRFSPPEFLQAIYSAFGPVDLDPCAHRLSPVVAQQRFFEDQGDDGLSDPWSGRLVYVNPPYSGVVDWLQRAHDEWAGGNVETVICLLPVRIDSPLFQDTVKPKADVYFLRGRLKFGREGGKPQPTPHSLMVVIFGATAQQKARFASLVRGFWAPATTQHGTAASGAARSAAISPSWNSRRITSSSCAATPRVLGEHPVRVCCGPSVRRRGQVR